LEEFAKLNRLDYKDNEAVYRWVEEGHAAKFAEHFSKVQDDIAAHCLARCGLLCKGDPHKCKLRKELHTLMKDKLDW
jgi:hypothetical protein